VVQLVLTRAQQQPVELDGRRNATCFGNSGGEWPLPDLVGRRVEQLEQLEARFGETAEWGVPRGLGLLTFYRRLGRRLDERLTQHLADRGKDPLCFIVGDVSYVA
jgi:hypothetical protein